MNFLACLTKSYNKVPTEYLNAKFLSHLIKFAGQHTEKALAEQALHFLGCIHYHVNQEQRKLVLDSGLIHVCIKRLDRGNEYN